MKKYLFAILALSLSCGMAKAESCNVRDYGAQASRIWYDTVAFQKAINACAGQGTVLVPRGEYLIGPITLPGKSDLHLDKGAEIVAASDPALYADAKALITISDADDVVIEGAGVINGQGAVWWEKIRAVWRGDPTFAANGAARQEQHDARPRLILARHASHLRFTGVTLENSPSFHLVLDHADHVLVQGVKISAPASSPNTDAIDPIDSHDVTITGNTISVGDDVVAIKSNGPGPAHSGPASSDITVTGNIIGNGRGICIGSGTSGGVAHILIAQNRFDGSLYGVRIKTRRGHGGEVRDIVIRDNSMKDVQIPLVFTSYYAYAPLDPATAQSQADTKDGGFLMGNQIWPGTSDPAQPYVTDSTPDIHDIVVDGLTAAGAQSAGIAIGLPEKSLRLRLRNVRINARTGFTVRNADIDAANTAFIIAQGPAMIPQKNVLYHMAAAR
jgi:polygalacturonase